MEKKIVYFLVSIFAALWIGGLIVYFYYSKKLESKPISQEQLGRIIERKDLTACNKISSKESSEICQDTVALMLAKEKLDISFCEKLKNKEDQISCQKMVLYDKAEKEGVMACQQFKTEEEKRDCEKEYYFTMAIQKNDINQCLNLNNEKEINECQKDFSQWQERN